MNERRGSHWQSVTGGVEDNEEFHQAAIREAQEETALPINHIQNLIETNYKFEFHDQWGNDVIEKVFLIHCMQKWDVQIDPNEHVDFKWVSEKEITIDSVHFESNFKALQIAMELKC